MKLNEGKDGVFLEVFVKPNNKKFEVAAEGDGVVVRCTEEPVKGKVNREIMKELSKILHSEVEVVGGTTSKRKLLLIKGAKKAEIEKLLTEKTGSQNI
ncbi:MAG: DUF167 domain-containing protein [Candidatus Bathyarchaeia archaeon]|jgi:uncharacterized protein (TIGR00251 family)